MVRPAGNTTFNVCPLNPRVAGVFTLAPRQLLKNRIPIAERAADAANNRRISLEQARAHSHLNEFELGSNRLQIFRIAGFDNTEQIAQAITHLGSAFKNRTIGFDFSRSDHSTSLVIVKVAPREIKLAANLYGPATVGHELLNLNFEINPDYIKMSRIGSMERKRGQGQAGQALTALYNIAKGLKMMAIYYGVHDHNSAAKRFYYHMDFGRPTNDRWTEWQVVVAG